MVTKVSRVRLTGPLAVHAVGFGSELAGLGYTPLSAANQLRLAAHLGRWLDEQGLAIEDLTEERVGEFVLARSAQGYTCWRSRRGVAPLMTYLRKVGAAPIPGPAVRTAVDEVLGEFVGYLGSERGLAAATVGNYAIAARCFLSARVADRGGDLGLAELTAAEVSAFVAEQCPRLRVGAAKNLVSGLRALLRFLHVAGMAPGPLAPAVLGVAGWRGSSLPRALPIGQVPLLLASCDRRRAVGRRDVAILMLLFRLGLRAGEVAAMELDDIDWRAGELLVRGKGSARSGSRFRSMWVRR